MRSHGIEVPAFILMFTSASLAASPHDRGGEMTDVLSAKSPHPEPRVIVNVLSVQGPHDRQEVQRAARNAWGRIVSCYKSFGERKRGSVELELAISGQGRVTQARHRGGSLENPDLAACLAAAMKRVEMPAAGGRSTALTEFQLGPGDAG